MLVPTGAQAQRHAVWVFSDEVSGETERLALVSRSAASHVTDLYVSVYQSILSSDGRLMYEDSDIAALISLARGAGILVWAAYGAPDWPGLGCSPTAFPLQRMQEILDYNAANPGAVFDGVIFDVEPPEPQTQQEYVDLLELYECSRDLLATGGVAFAMAIRFFWEDDVLFDGEIQPVYAHVMDLAPDHVVVMGYRDHAGSDCAGGDANGIICLDEAEIAYADSQGLPEMILAGLETTDCAPGCGPETVTFFEEQQDVMNAEAQLVTTHYLNSASFGGFAVHRYGAPYLGDQPGWPESNTALFPTPKVPALSNTVLSAAALVLLSLGVLAARRGRS